jgi:NADPH:quinone reductase-like Zn-dependent oxidoreductase
LKAIAVIKPGAPAQMIDVETPTPAAGEIRVELRAAGVNPVDGKSASGAYGQVSAPSIPGVDGAGVVDMLGRESRRFVVGERVFGRLGHPGWGTFAQYVVVPESGMIARMPDGLDFGVAAAIPVAGLTALGVLRELDLPAGGRLLIIGATGGVGVFLTQLATRTGVVVIATARPELAQETQRLGASVTIDHTSPVALPDQLDALGVTQLDALVDLVGDKVLTDTLSALLRPGGKAISTAGGIDPERLSARQISRSSYHGQPTAEMLEELGALVQSGEITVPIERELSLADAPQALEESRGGHMHGKTILRVSVSD